MKTLPWLGFTAAALFVFCAGASAQAPMHPPCAIFCPPDKVVNQTKCACEDPNPQPRPPCALVCPTPGQKLDADQCKCVASPP
jgi:hypothetical protein